jgi:hypothetical protein
MPTKARERARSLALKELRSKKTTYGKKFAYTYYKENGGKLSFSQASKSPKAK